MGAKFWHAIQSDLFDHFDGRENISIFINFLKIVYVT